MTDHRADALRYLGYAMQAGKVDEDSIVEATAGTLHALLAIHDLLDTRLPTKGDPCPCGCRRDVEPKPTGVTEPESVTVTLPRDVVERARVRLVTAAQWASEDKHPFSAQGHLQAARALSDAIADALGGQS